MKAVATFSVISAMSSLKTTVLAHIMI